MFANKFWNLYIINIFASEVQQIIFCFKTHKSARANRYQREILRKIKSLNRFKGCIYFYRHSNMHFIVFKFRGNLVTKLKFFRHLLLGMHSHSCTDISFFDEGVLNYKIWMPHLIPLYIITTYDNKKVFLPRMNPS